MAEADARTRRAALIERIRALSRPLEPIPTDMAARLPQLPDIRAVLLDVYGTMVISGSGDVGVRQAQDNTTALTEALRESGLASERADEAAERGLQQLHAVIERAHETRQREGVEYPEVDIRAVWCAVLSELHERELIRTAADDHTIARLAVEYECRVNPVWPMPGLDRMIAAVRRGGRRLGIISNAQFFTPLVLEALLEAKPTSLGFDADLCIWSYQLLEAKPSTGLYERALRRLDQRAGISPQQVLYVGNDLLNDMKPAAELGCRTALFAGDQRSLRLREDDPRCEAVEPDAILTRLDQIHRLIPDESALH